jgi:hypothetical protein
MAFLCFGSHIGNKAIKIRVNAQQKIQNICQTYVDEYIIFFYRENTVMKAIINMGQNEIVL